MINPEVLQKAIKDAEAKVTACEKELTAKKNAAAAARKVVAVKDAAVKDAEAKLASAKQAVQNAKKKAADNASSTLGLKVPVNRIVG